MAIDFHLQKNRYSYANRIADSSWSEAITARIDPVGKRVADIGCGGGIYTQAWHALGAEEITGVDFSAQMLLAARATAAGLANVSFQQGDASATGLASDSVDIVFQRALLHHLKNYDTCFAEASRLLTHGGTLLVQERTPEDVDLPGSAEHIRGYVYEYFPRLMTIEALRRPSKHIVRQALLSAGFRQIEARTLWETRKTHASFEALARDLSARTGRSILHELDDAELQELITYIGTKIPGRGAITEKDRWTLWSAVKP